MAIQLHTEWISLKNTMELINRLKNPVVHLKLRSGSCSRKYLLNENSHSELGSWGRWPLTLHRKRKSSGEKKMNIRWKCFLGCINFWKAVLELIHTSELGHLRRERWVNMMVTSQGYYWTKFKCSSQEFKILYQCSNLVIMVSKVTLCQLKITFCAWVCMLDDNWIR